MEYDVDWQHMVVLIHALNELGAVPTKDDAIRYIQRGGFLHLRPGDLAPYESQQEASWITDIAWARKDAVIMQLVDDIEWNSWDILPAGRTWIEGILSRGRRDELEVNRCFLWSVSFRKFVSPSYVPSILDVEAREKGQRCPSPLQGIKEQVSEILEKTTIPKLAESLSAKLGAYVKPTESSVAFAYYRYLNKILRDVNLDDILS